MLGRVSLAHKLQKCQKKYGMPEKAHFGNLAGNRVPFLIESQAIEPLNGIKLRNRKVRLNY